jgi:hypothetical protein
MFKVTKSSILTELYSNDIKIDLYLVDTISGYINSQLEAEGGRESLINQFSGVQLPINVIPTAE